MGPQRLRDRRAQYAEPSNTNPLASRFAPERVAFATCTWHPDQVHLIVLARSVPPVISRHADLRHVHIRTCVRARSLPSQITDAAPVGIRTKRERRRGVR